MRDAEWVEVFAGLADEVDPALTTLRGAEIPVRHVPAGPQMSWSTPTAGAAEHIMVPNEHADAARRLLGVQQKHSDRRIPKQSLTDARWVLVALGAMVLVVALRRVIRAPLWVSVTAAVVAYGVVVLVSRRRATAQGTEAMEPSTESDNDPSFDGSSADRD